MHKGNEIVCGSLVKTLQIKFLRVYLRGNCELLKYPKESSCPARGLSHENSHGNAIQNRKEGCARGTEFLKEGLLIVWMRDGPTRKHR